MSVDKDNMALHIPIGSTMEPSIIGGRRSSGFNFLVVAKRFAYQVLVKTASMIAASIIPMNKLMKGSEATSGLQPRSKANAYG